MTRLARSLLVDAAARLALWPLLGLSLLPVACSEVIYEPRAGDVLFQSLPHSPLVDAIEGVSDSPYSHCGVVLVQDGEALVLEAFVDVRATPIDTWIDRGRGDAFSVHRLTDARREHVDDFLAAAREYLDRPYDYHYAMDDGAIYCSELVWKAWRDATGEELCAVVPLRDLHWQAHVETIERLEGGGVPLDRPLITPRAVAESPALPELLRHGWEADR